MQFILEEFAIILFLTFIIIFSLGVFFLLHIQNKILMNEYQKANRETGVITKEKYLLGNFSIVLKTDEILKIKTNQLYNE